MENVAYLQLASIMHIDDSLNILKQEEPSKSCRMFRLHSPWFISKKNSQSQVTSSLMLNRLFIQDYFSHIFPTSHVKV